MSSTAQQKRFKLGSAVMNACSMKPELAELVVTEAEAALKRSMTEEEVAQAVRAGLLKALPDCAWQVIVGRNLGAFVTCIEGYYAHFYIAQTGFVVWAS